MKKAFAFLASVLMVSSCAGLSVSATDVVIAVKEDDSSAWVTTSHYMSSEDIADLNPSQEIFEFGDIVEYKNILFMVDDVGQRFRDGLLTWREDTLSPYLTVGKEDQPYSISKVGSIFDDPQTAQFTVVEKRDRDKLFLADDEGNSYEYKFDWLRHGYYQPDCVDVSALHSGDVVTCITHHGNPMLVTEVTSAAPPSGDANGDGRLTISDVIIMNKAILGKATLVQSDQIYHVDFNQNGVPDSEDSLTMLKMIVGLE